jgi:hypothetical protein
MPVPRVSAITAFPAANAAATWPTNNGEAGNSHGLMHHERARGPQPQRFDYSQVGPASVSGSPKWRRA